VASFRPLFKSLHAIPFVLFIFLSQIATQITKRAYIKMVLLKLNVDFDPMVIGAKGARLLLRKAG
jgi:hypothetical protein